mmetsp:Transcript_21551/g.48803  ORF Transcript_21551/g.48803 Transcript_21551/m.48803 type:complete len:207 (-) Transcript_21551:362-982(-)
MVLLSCRVRVSREGSRKPHHTLCSTTFCALPLSSSAFRVTLNAFNPISTGSLRCGKKLLSMPLANTNIPSARTCSIRSISEDSRPSSLDDSPIDFLMGGPQVPCLSVISTAFLPYRGLKCNKMLLPYQSSGGERLRDQLSESLGTVRRRPRVFLLPPPSPSTPPYSSPSPSGSPKSGSSQDWGTGVALASHLSSDSSPPLEKSSCG